MKNRLENQQSAPEQTHESREIIEVINCEKRLIPRFQGAARSLAKVFVLITAGAFIEGHGEVPSPVMSAESMTVKKQEEAQGLPSGRNAVLGEREGVVSKEADLAFVNDLSLMTRFGMCLDHVAQEKKNILLQRYKDRLLDPNLRDIVGDMITDPMVYAVAEQYFKDGGRIEAWPESGHYSPDQKLISIGLHDQGHDPRQTGIHELLHYVLLKMNTAIAGRQDAGGGDHAFIDTIDNRWEMVNTIRKGQLLNPEQFDIVYCDAKGRRLIDDVKGCYLPKNIASFRSLLDSNEFFTRCVQGIGQALRGTAEREVNFRDFRVKMSNGHTLRFSEDHRRDKPDTVKMVDYKKGSIYINCDIKNIQAFDSKQLDPYVAPKDRAMVDELIDTHQKNSNLDRSMSLTSDQIQDILYGHAVNAAIFQQSLRLAFIMSEKEFFSIDKIIATSQYQKTFEEFLKIFLKSLQENPKIPPLELSSQAVLRVIAQNAKKL